jgi:hypothetical protein
MIDELVKGVKFRRSWRDYDLMIPYKSTFHVLLAEAHQSRRSTSRARIKTP